MLDSCGLIAEFSQAYGQGTHENKCISITQQSIPTLEEINDMLKQNEKIQMSLQSVRDIILSHHDKTLAFATGRS
jgi:glutamate--cysteine ligase catalytic subunit